MQPRANFAFLSLSFIATAALSGCVIIGSGTTGSGGNGGSGGDGGRDATGTGGTGGVGGTGGTGGVGGEGGAGVGGGPNCVGPEDGTNDAAACDAMPITPSSEGGTAASICGDTKDQPPPGYGLCKRAYQIYQAGAASKLQACLDAITVEPANACSIDLVTKCVDEMYKAACPSQASADTCKAISTQLCINGEIFDTQKCLEQTNPFNNTALQDLVDKISASSEPDCNKAYAGAFDEIASF